MKNTKKKGLLIGIAILSALSIGYIVNSQSGGNQKSKIVDSIPYAYTRNGKPFKQNVLSNNEFVTTLGASNNDGKYKFKGDGSDFDGIPAQAISGYEPWTQLWDGLKNTEKSKMTLITKNTEIKKEIIDKNTGKPIPIPIQGVRFCQKVDYELSPGEEQYCSEPTNEKGITWLEVDKMAYGESTLVEKFDDKVYKIDPYTKGKTETEVKQAGDPVKIYVDLGTRFLGETSGNDLITYQGLVEQIEEAPLSKGQINGKNLTKVGCLGKQDKYTNNWLKIYDIRTNKVLYIAKQPVTTLANKNNLFKAGLVYGLDKLNLSTFNPNTDAKITTIQLQDQYKNLKNYESYIGKAIKIKDRWFVVRLLRGTKNQSPFIDENSEFKNEMFYNSEWNRYILPLVKENRYKDSIDNVIEASLKEKKRK